MERFTADLGLPTRVRESGVDHSELASVATSPVADMVVTDNPRPVRSLSELTELPEASY